MKFKNNRGQVTVLLSIILLAVILLAGVIVDASRISAGRTLVKNAVNSAARSALADYASNLKEDYGIFALSRDQEGRLCETVEKYMAENLTIPGNGQDTGGLTDMYGFRIESVKVTPLFNLSENSIFKQQILEYMKYRAPKEIVEGFVDRLSAVRETGKMSVAYKKKVGIDKIFGKMDKYQQKLKKNVDGSGAQNEIYVNGFNLNNRWTAAFKTFNSMCADAGILENKLSAIEDKIANLQTQMNSSSGGEDSGTGEAGKDADNEKSDMEERLLSLFSERNSVMQDIAAVKGELADKWNEIRYLLTGDYTNANEEAEKNVGNIIEKGRKAEESLNDLEAYLNENFDGSGELSGEFTGTLKDEIKELRNLILDGKKAADIQGRLNSNEGVLNELTGRLDRAWNELKANGMEGISAGLPEQLLDYVSSYKNVEYDYEKPEKGEKKDDPRAEGTEAAEKTLLAALADDISYLDAGISTDELPSHTKVRTPSFDEEDAPYIGQDARTEDGGGTDTNGGEAVYRGNLGNVGGDIDLQDEDGSFEENALGFMGDIGGAVTGSLSKLRDDIYINEYIMGTFKNAVPVLKQGTEEINDTGFGGVDKAERQTFYQDEVEYILHGNASQNANMLMTKAQILLVRFGLDTLHVYTDAKKKEIATGIATAAAGWWTGGAGIPILSNLIMCGWGMGEAVIDLNDIMNGKSVPIFKQKGDWKLDIGLPGGGKKTDARLCFSYYDYLRLFLLVMNEDKKLGRMEDLIELNIRQNDSGFKMSGCNTYIRVEAEVSMKYLFLPQPFVPSGIRMKNGRYVYRVLLYEGY